MSISFISILIEQAAADKVRPAQLLSMVKQGDQVRYKDKSAKFVKRAPGDFLVEYFDGADVVRTDNASSPTEAKLLVLDYLIDAAANIGALPEQPVQGMAVRRVVR